MPKQEFPILMEWSGVIDKYDSEKSHKLVVLFTGQKEFIVVHSENVKGRPLGQYINYAVPYDDNDWKRFKGVINLEND